MSPSSPVARARISARIPTPESGHRRAILEPSLQSTVPEPPTNTPLEEEKKTLEVYEWPSTEDIPEKVNTLLQYWSRQKKKQSNT